MRVQLSLWYFIFKTRQCRVILYLCDFDYASVEPVGEYGRINYEDGINIISIEKEHISINLLLKG